MLLLLQCGVNVQGTSEETVVLETDSSVAEDMDPILKGGKSIPHYNY